jgi:hypothetical protein
MAAMGLALALSVNAQTTTTDEKQQPAKQPAQQEENARAEQNTNVDQNTNAGQQKFSTSREANRAKGRSKEHKDIRSHERSMTASGGVTVFRGGRETKENLNLRRVTRDRSSVHFRIGTHPREWWIRTYSIVLMEGCHYYLAHDGCWYPAYGFDPGCNYPEGVVYCED